MVASGMAVGGIARFNLAAPMFAAEVVDPPGQQEK
jgi:hypothetical protein